MTIEFKWTELTKTADSYGNTVEFTDDKAERWEEAELAKKKSLDLPVPIYITGPGTYAPDPVGALLSMDASGAVYRDAKPMKGIAAQKLCVVGRSIYGKGKTVPSWWLWNGTNWGTLPVTDGDPTILN